MENKASLKEKINDFTLQQQSVGISLQTFKQKFVFNQNSGLDAIFLDINTPSPSQILGMTHLEQNFCVFMMAELLFKAGQSLKLPVSTTMVALNIAQYYYTRKSYFDYDMRQICMGAMFLACKSQQTLRKSYQIASTFDYVFKMYEGTKVIRQLELNSLQYNFIKDRVSKTQNEILFQLGFQVQKLFDIPHRYISGLIASFSKHKLCNQIAQNSWTFLNDIYRTKAVVHYPGQIIASAAVIFSLRKLNISIPHKPWWILMQSNIGQISIINVLVNQMYQTIEIHKPNMNKVSQILENIGKKILKVSNVFPVPYYRKINIEKQGLLMKPIEEDKVCALKNEKNEEFLQKQKQKSSFQKGKYLDDHEDKEKNKKQKKKEKKKHKHHRNGNRSRSKSEQKKELKKKGKFQNDDETPKINRKQSLDLASKYKNEQLIEVQNCNNEVENTNRKKSYDEDVHIKKSARQQQIFGSQKENVMKKGTNLIQKEGFSSEVKGEQSGEGKKSVLFGAKSMLSKISQQLKKIEVKNQLLAISNANNQKMGQSQIKNGRIEENKQKIDEQSRARQKSDKMQSESKEHSRNQQGEIMQLQGQSSSSEQQEDQLMAELIQIRKKNLQKKLQSQNP